jgi:hypothetical protein
MKHADRHERRIVHSFNLVVYRKQQLGGQISQSFSVLFDLVDVLGGTDLIQ